MLIRFLLVVRPWHPVVAGGLVLVVAGAAVLLAAGRVSAGDALAPVLLLQTLVVSSGFAGPARRGHYDFLIASGQKRLAIAVAHWAVSATPGLAAWLALALIDLLVSGGRTLLSAPTVTAVVVASTLPWAVTVPLPRLTGGLVWVLFERVSAGGAAATVPTPVVIVVTATAMLAAVTWIEHADFPLEAAQ
jgi:hypothetical protein